MPYEGFNLGTVVITSPRNEDAIYMHGWQRERSYQNSCCGFFFSFFSSVFEFKILSIFIAYIHFPWFERETHINTSESHIFILN